GRVRAAPLAALPGGPRGPGDVRGAMVVVLAPAAALRRGGDVRAAVRRVPLRGRVRAGARRAHRLPRGGLAHDGTGAQRAPGGARARPAVGVAPRAGAAARAPRGGLTGARLP